MGIVAVLWPGDALFQVVGSGRSAINDSGRSSSVDARGESRFTSLSAVTLRFGTLCACRSDRRLRVGDEVD